MDLNPKAVDQQDSSVLALSLANTWLTASCKICIEQSFVLLYWSQNKKIIFLDHATKESKKSIQQWQKKLWQLSLQQFENP